MPTGSRLTVPVPQGFDLSRVVCSYGYFMLAPNQWCSESRSLRRPIRIGESPQRNRTATIRVRQPATPSHRLTIHCDRSLSASGQRVAKQAVRRMLRLDEDLSGWFDRHREARQEGFGRLFRSPTLFEDIVKTITGCNVAWPNTMRMNRLLCDKVGDGAFPSPQQLSRLAPKALKAKTKVGYRAERIIRLARRVDSGELDLTWFESPERTSDEAYAELRRIHGLGPYAAANVCQLLGFYDQLAIDSETYRHFRKHFDVDDATPDRALHARIVRHYERYTPYQFLAYWRELWRDYEHRLGPASSWTSDAGTQLTGAHDSQAA